MKTIGRVLLRSGGALIALKLVSLVGGGIGVNLMNALLVGVLGAPGVGLLLMGNLLI